MGKHMPRSTLSFVPAFALTAALLACSSQDANPGGASMMGGGGGAGIGANGSTGNGAQPSASGGPTLTIGGSHVAEAGGSSGPVCATVTTQASLDPVYLAFAFDVSGSMGKGDHPWHDAALKWDPVVAATRSFFEDQASTGLFASLTAFPSADDEDERCESTSYTSPDVAMAELPSAAFGEALAAIREDDWRGGTPTLSAVQGVLEYVRAHRVDHPGRYALVLVTDGYPQGCDDDDIDSVEAAVRDVADEIPTYVIGVRNPPLVDADGDAAPDTVSNLTGVAEAGGTERAFLIDTGDADKTLADFRGAIDEIRGVALACNLSVPAAPDGRVFQKDQVVVSYQSGAARTELVYDESCTAAGAWHYDDLAQPSQVILCPATCSAVQAGHEAELGAQLEVGFTCEPVIDLPH